MLIPFIILSCVTGGLLFVLCILMHETSSLTTRIEQLEAHFEQHDKYWNTLLAKALAYNSKGKPETAEKGKVNTKC